MFTIATLVPMFTIITIGFYTCSKQSKTSRTKFNVFAENLSLFHFFDLDTQIDTLHFYITEVDPVSIQWWIMEAEILQLALLHC